MGEVLMWNNIRKVFSLTSIIIAGFATGMPDATAKVFFAVALGFSNAAIYLKSENGEKKKLKEAGE